MARVAVVYFSKTDVTQALVKAAVAELEELGLHCFVHLIKGEEIVEGRFVKTDILTELSAADAIIFASPTYMGGAAAQFKAFADVTGGLWSEQAWAGKIAAGITCGSAPNGDQSGTLQYFITLANQHGMYWVGLDAACGQKDHGVNRLGCQLGVVAHSLAGRVDPVDLASARHLGRRVGALVQRLHR